MLGGFTKQAMQEPLLFGSASAKASLGFAVTLKSRSATLAQAVQTVAKRGAKAVENAVSDSVATVNARVKGISKFGLHEPLFEEIPLSPGSCVELQQTYKASPELDQLIAMGFNEKDARRALEAADNNVTVAVSCLSLGVNSPNRKEVEGGRRRRHPKSKHMALSAEKAALSQFELIDNEFALQVGLLHRRHDIVCKLNASKATQYMHCHILEETLAIHSAPNIQSGIRPTSEVVRPFSKPVPQSTTFFLPSVCTWLQPRPFNLQPQARGSRPRCMGNIEHPEQVALRLKAVESQSKAELLALHEKYSRAVDAVYTSYIHGDEVNEAVTTCVANVPRRERDFKSKVMARRCGT